MRRVGNIIFSLFGLYIFYAVAKFFWDIYPLHEESEHIRETVGDVYIIYLVIGLALFLFICINSVIGDQTNILNKLDKIQKKLDSIESATSKTPTDSTVIESQKDITAELDSEKKEEQV